MRTEAIGRNIGDDAVGSDRLLRVWIASMGHEPISISEGNDLYPRSRMSEDEFRDGLIRMCEGDDPALRKSLIIYPDIDREFEIRGEDVQDALETGRVTDPVSGLILDMRKTPYETYYSPIIT